MSNLALQLNLLNSITVSPNSNIIFDTVPFITGDITYDNITGDITLSQPGIYYISWWVTSQAIISNAGSKFTLVSSEGDNLIGNSPLKAGETYGMGVIQVEGSPITISLQNSNDGSFFFPNNLNVKASLAVIYEPAAVNGLECFAYSQLAHVLSQLVNIYSESTWLIFSYAFASFSGVPLEVFTSPNADEPGLLVLIDSENGLEIFPISQITAISVGSGTIYDENITYLPAPNPLPAGCDAAVLDAVRAYFPIGTPITNMRLGVLASASGQIYRNELGLIVLSDSQGNTPIFVPTPHIQRVYLAAPGIQEGVALPEVKLIEDEKNK